RTLRARRVADAPILVQPFAGGSRMSRASVVRSRRVRAVRSAAACITVAHRQQRPRCHMALTRREFVSGIALGAVGGAGMAAAAGPTIEPRQAMRAAGLPVIVSAANG